MNNQYKSGAVLSYLNIILNMAISIFFIPFLISSLGESEYGVYKIVQSFSGQLSIMSFGIATLIVRNTVFFNAKKQKEEKENFLFFAFLATYIFAAIILVAGGIMYGAIDVMYKSSMTAKEISIAKILFVLLILNIAATIICDSYSGLIKAHEKFGVSYGIETAKLILRVALMVSILKLGGKSVLIVSADLSITVSAWILIMLYGRFRLKERAKYHRFDGQLLKQCFVFSLAIFLQRIINQVNQNLDNVILGMMTNTAIVAMYSIALTIFTSFGSVVTTIGTLFTPKATQMIANDATGEELTSFISTVGRWQFMISGLVITGFILFGKSFIILWVGRKYINVYYLSIILLIPAVIPHITSVSMSILDAMLKRLGASIILVIMCIVNIGVSVVFIKYIGFWGAAIGTAVSFIIGHGILFNIYLHKVANISIFKMYKDILRRSFIGVVACLLIGIPITFIPYGIAWFILKVIIYTVIYALVMYFLCMNASEKSVVKSFIKIR